MDAEMLEWKPSNERWMGVGDATWRSTWEGHTLVVHKGPSNWYWHVLTPEGLTVSGVWARNIRDAMAAAEGTLMSILGLEKSPYAEVEMWPYCDD